MSQHPTAQTQNMSTNYHQLAIAIPTYISSVPPTDIPLPLSPTTQPTMPVMSDNNSHSYSGIPKLTKLNYYDWAMQVKAYLMGPADHWHVIEGDEKADGSYDQPEPPTDKTSKEWIDWRKSKCMACGVIMATARQLHGELILQNKGKLYNMWKAIEAQHLQHDASLHHEAWMQFLALHKKVEERYADWFHCIKSTYAKVLHITPKNQTAKQHGQELTLFTILSGLPHDNSLH